MGKNEEAIGYEAVGGDRTDDPTATRRPQSDGTSLTTGRPKELLVDGKPLREVLDPVGAAAWSNETGEAVADSCGDEIADTESDKDSRFERLRKRGFEKGDDALDAAEKGANQANDLLSKHPPAGHSETPTGPALSDAPHVGIDPGNMVTAAIVAGMLAGDGIRWFHRKLRDKGED
jgi:hypothetical protein